MIDLDWIRRRTRQSTGRLGLLPVVALALGGAVSLKVAHLATGGVETPVSISSALAQGQAAGANSAAESTPIAAVPNTDTSADQAEESTAPEDGPEPVTGEQTGGQPPATASDTTASDVLDRPADEAAGGGGSAPRLITKSEIEVLNRLTERRKELEQRARDLEMREKLLRVAERKIDEKLSELKQIESRIEATFERQEEEKNDQFKSLVSMYENMKPKEAARIFDTLDMDVLLSVVEQMRARKVAPILASMSAEAAQRLTVELAARASGEINAGPQSLPTIPDSELR